MFNKFMMVLVIVSSSIGAQASEFDHNHVAWTEVLESHVITFDGDKKSAVDYAALVENRDQLDAYLTDLSAVSNTQYEAFSDNQKLSFLINAYNAFTLQLIIDHWDEFAQGDAESIRDLGGVFTSPWEQEFFNLLGERRHLDWLEHERIRVNFDEPRIHAALVCAAKSCPKLRREAFVAERLDSQLQNQMVTFLSDRDINGIDSDGLYLSKIMDWYSEDFGDLRSYLRQADFAKALANSASKRDQLESTDIPIRYTDYDWRLNRSQHSR